MKNENSKTISSRKITYMAILTALVVVLQTALGSIRIGATSFSVVLIPIVIGSILLGATYGAILGFIFGIIVLVYGITGADPFTNFLFSNSSILTVLTCLVKGVVCGFVPGIVYKALYKKNIMVATVLSSCLAPILNTGLFIVGGLLMSGTLTNSVYVEDGQTVVYFLIIVCAGINFLVEFLVTAVVAPSLTKLIKVVDRRF